MLKRPPSKTAVETLEEKLLRQHRCENAIMEACKRYNCTLTFDADVRSGNVVGGVIRPVAQ